MSDFKQVLENLRKPVDPKHIKQREGIGTGVCDSELGIKKAEHDALKRAAVKFGVARELYRKEGEGGGESSGGHSSGGNSGGGRTWDNSKPQNPTAGDKATSKQLGMLRALCNETGYEAEQMANSVFGYELEDLNKKAVSFLIEELKKVQSGEGQADYPTNDKNASERPQTQNSGISGANQYISQNQMNAISRMCNAKGVDIREIERQFCGGGDIAQASSVTAGNIIAHLNKL